MTIRNCWHKAGILPNMNSLLTPLPVLQVADLLDDTSSQINLITCVENQIEARLNKLVTKGVLPAANKMNIDSLLNPDGESQISTQMSDIKIYHTVMDKSDAHKIVDIDDDIDLDPHPTSQDALKAIHTLHRYAADFNSSGACKMEACLDSFTMEIRHDESKHMISTQITDYFKKTQILLFILF